MSFVPHPTGSLSPFDQTRRTRLVFGCGVLSRLGELARELGARRVLLVTDRGIVAAGHAGRALDALKDSGVEATVFEDVRENPTTVDIDRCLKVARGQAVDLIVGLGGGSSMDTAKGTNFLLTNGGEIRDYWGVGKATKPMLPLIAIPTTAGTGSECQSAALIADEKTHQKMACLDAKAAARIALLDPELTVSQPQRVTAVTGVDALAHAVETSVTTIRNAVSLMYSHEAFKRLIHALPRVLANPQDIDARGQMLLGAAFAGLAIEASMLGAAHSAANPLTAHFGVVHGAAVGVMLPHVVRFNAAKDEHTRRAYAELASAPELAAMADGVEPAVDALVARLESILNDAGIPRSLADAGVDGGQIRVLAEEAAHQWTAQFNPRSCGITDFLVLYESALQARGPGDRGGVHSLPATT